MGLFLDAAGAWNDLRNVSYIFEVARKGVLKRIELSFLAEDFPHLAGMQYARDVDFGIRPAEYYGAKLVPALLSGKMKDHRIETSRNWDKISGRLTAIIYLQNTLDGNFVIVSFDKAKVKGYSQIDAEFAIRSTISDDIYFVFLDKRSGRYYCKSAFRKDITDYAENQSPMTILQKIKIVDDQSSILFCREGYQPDDTITDKIQ